MPALIFIIIFSVRAFGECAPPHTPPVIASFEPFPPHVIQAHQANLAQAQAAYQACTQQAEADRLAQEETERVAQAAEEEVFLQALVAGQNWQELPYNNLSFQAGADQRLGRGPQGINTWSTCVAILGYDACAAARTRQQPPPEDVANREASLINQIVNESFGERSSGPDPAIGDN